MNDVFLIFSSLHTMFIFVFSAGLIAGSFLNVVIHRYPLMLRQRWDYEYRSLTTESVSVIRTLTLSVPRSHCPHCLRPIRVYDNIPLFSWLFLKGRCRDCGVLISKRYPLVELLTGGLFLVAALIWQENGWSIAVMVLSALLITGSMIDIEHHWLPDIFTQGVLWLGIILAWGGLSPLGLHQAVGGVITGYMSFYGVRCLFFLLINKEALGMGDVWLFAGIGAWVGWEHLMYVALTASVMGLGYGICTRKTSAHIAFGPFLSLGAGGVIFYQGMFPEQACPFFSAPAFFSGISDLCF